MRPDAFPLKASIRFLHELAARNIAPEQALERLGSLRSVHPDVDLELVWELDVAGRPRYDLLIGGNGEASVCLSVELPTAVPLAIRGAARGGEVPLDDPRVHGREVELRSRRSRLVGAEARAAFAADPRRWDRIALAAFPATDYGQAMVCVEALRAGEPWLALAERVLSERTDGEPANRSIVFDRVRRGHIETLGEYALGDAMFLAARLDGRGPYVVQVRAIEAAVWDDSTREAIEDELFVAWLGRTRATAPVEGNGETG